MYFCKNCGEAYTTDEAVMCVKCGVSKGQGSNYCQNCGEPVQPGTAVCLNCGATVIPKGGEFNFQQPVEPQQTNVLAIISLIVGILSIPIGCCSIGIGGIVLGIIGIVLAVCANKQGKTGLATAGLVCSIVGIVIWVGILVITIGSFAMLAATGYGY